MPKPRTVPKTPKASTKRETRIEAIRHRASHANIPTEELRDFVADGEKTPGSGSQ